MRLHLKGNYTQEVSDIDVLTKDHTQHFKKEKVVLTPLPSREFNNSLE